MNKPGNPGPYVTPKAAKKRWIIAVEDRLYFYHDIPAKQVESLTQAAFQTWGLDFDTAWVASKVAEEIGGKVAWGISGGS